MNTKRWGEVLVNKFTSFSTSLYGEDFEEKLLAMLNQTHTTHSLIFQYEQSYLFQVRLYGGDSMNNESDKTNRTIGDGVGDPDPICEACCL